MSIKVLYQRRFRYGHNLQILQLCASMSFRQLQVNNTAIKKNRRTCDSNYSVIL